MKSHFLLYLVYAAFAVQPVDTVPQIVVANTIHLPSGNYEMTDARLEPLP
jgi:hypothetical protein